MELFVTGIPAQVKPKVLDRAIAQAVKRTFRSEPDQVAYEFRTLRRSPQSGKLTFPTPSLGRRFLSAYAYSGLRFNDHTIRFRRSKYDPDARLIEGLQRQMDEKKPWDSDSEDEDISSRFSTKESTAKHADEGVPFKNLEWGVWKLDGSFGHCGTIERDGLLSYDPQVAELQALDMYDVFSSRGFPVGQEENGIDFANESIYEILIDNFGVSRRIYFTLERIPRFWSQNPSRHTSCGDIVEEPDAIDSYRTRNIILPIERDKGFSNYRVPALCSEHAIDAPYSTVYVFNLEGPECDKRLKQLLKAMRRQGTEAPIKSSAEGLGRSLTQLGHLYRKHDYRVAFQMEMLVRNCLLLPQEVFDLDNQFPAIAQIYGVESTVRIFQTLASRLPFRANKTLSEGIDLVKLLREACQAHNTWKPRPDANYVWIHRLDITPAAYNMEGPEWVTGNRVLRLFPEHHHHFIKVSFVDENLCKIRYSRDINLFSILQLRWGHMLKKGITVAGRHFEFLAFSSSSLREHSTWFMAPFTYESKQVSAETLRSELGDFSAIRCPPRLAARIGQTFTSTTHSIELKDENVKLIRDVVRENHLFSDGVGTMSRLMLNRIWEATAADDVTDKPVVYQIRLGGSKGVLSLDATLPGCVVCLRPSMVKFPAPYTYLELASKGRTLPFFLNRQMIVIMETLGLPSENLIKLQDKEVGRLELASKDFDAAFRLCQQYGLGHAPNLPSILRNLQKQDIHGIFEMPFFRRLNSLALSHALKQIKHKSRVAVENSWTLMGVLDEFDLLGENEIFVRIKDKTTGVSHFLKGPTLVTRMPALHCGDMQQVTAIGRLPFNNPLCELYNCIVFSSRGAQPVPNMLSGGDLDGDLYQVTQAPELFPPNSSTSDEYPHIVPQTLPRECNIDDIADFFLDFIVNDRLGQICSMHQVLADQSDYGVADSNCVKLSRLASQAVDFPKTGWPVDMARAPRVNTQIKPDFMARQRVEDDFIAEPQSSTSAMLSTNFGGRPDRARYYNSTKVLGDMYRRVDIPILLKTWNSNSGWNSEGPKLLRQKIECNLKELTPSYEKSWSGYVNDAKQAFARYMEELTMIQWSYHPTPWKHTRLSEAEVFLQCIQMDPGDRYIRGRGRSDYLNGLRQEYGELVDWVKSQVTATIEGQYRRAAAFFQVGIEAGKRKDKEGESFAWIIVPELFEAWKRVEENDYSDGDTIFEDVGWTDRTQTGTDTIIEDMGWTDRTQTGTDTIMNLQNRFGVAYLGD